MSNAKQVPAVACQFNAGPFAFGGDTPGDHLEVRLTARTGKPIKHWYWGRIVHDLAGMHLHKPTLPIDYCHRDDEVIGYLDTFETDSGDLVASGRLVPFAEEDRANEVRHKADAGVPYEASIFFGGDGVQLEQVAKNATAEVNGSKFEGPGVIVRKWPLRGVAVCPYGADMHTQTALSQDEKVTVEFSGDEPMANDVDTPEVQDDAADQANQLTDAGADPKQVEPDNPAPQVPASQAADTDTTEPSDGTHTVTFIDDTAASAICKKYVDAFGPKGGEWLAEGLSFDEAQERHTAELKAENEQLRQKFAAVDRGEDEPAEFSQGSEEPDAGKASQAMVDNHGDTLAPLVAFNASKMPGRN